MDLFVYAPLGLLLNAEELLPQLIEKGRQQVGMARMFGEFAVKQGQTEAEKAVARVQETAGEVLGQLGGRRNHLDPIAPERTMTQAADPPSAAQAPAPEPSGPAVETLAIPDYDSLSASQVVPRLEGLARSELDAVRAYESVHRGRKTILNKIAQLQA